LTGLRRPAERLLQFTTLAPDESLERVSQVLQEVKAIGDLNGLRRALTDAVGISLSAIPRDDLDLRVVLESGR
jgi:hypothetical protein